MDHARAFAISAAGMAAERARVEVATLNLANAHTLQEAGGGFQPLQVVATAASGTHALAGTFAEQVEMGLEEEGLRSLPLPQVQVIPSAVEPKKIYEPGNPFADAKGFVTYPGVDPATEMMTLMSALRSYEANVAAMNAAKTLALKALDIGGGA